MIDQPYRRRALLHVRAARNPDIP